MKLLLDQNLSPRLVTALSDEYPESVHVREFGMQSSEDGEIWNIAAQRGYAILSKDADFHQRSLLYGHPPKVVWVRLGNCSTEQILQVLRRSKKRIAALGDDQEASLLVLP